MSTQTDNRTQAMTFTPTKTNPVHVLSLDEIKSVVPDEEAAIAYLEEQRWGESRHCVREVDEVHLGGVEKNKHAKKKLGVGGGTGGKQPVLRLKERGGRVVLLPVADATKETLQGKIREVVETGLVINTDEHKSCRGIDIDGKFTHFQVSHSAREFVKTMTPDRFVTTNSAESVFAVVRRQFVGTHHWWSKKHTWSYMNEAAFRLNEGTVKAPTVERLSALFGNMAGKRIRLAEIQA